MPKSSLLRKLSVGVDRINWTEFVQSIASGAGNTVGVMIIYVVVIAIVVASFRRARRMAAETAVHGSVVDSQAQSSDVLSSILQSRPVAAFDIVNSQTQSTDPSSWI